VKNGGETAIDCGGATLANGKPNPASDGAPACVTGKTCAIGTDCASDVCASGAVLVDNLDGGVDATPAKGDAGAGLTCQAATAHDGVKNDSETDVDCGGALLASGSVNPASDGAPTCAANKGCVLASDCQAGVCTNGVCQSPSASDMVKNDSETDVDCGGGTLANGQPNAASDGAPACDDTKACVLGTDCANFVCSTGPVVAAAGSTGKPINCPAGQTCTCQAPTPVDGVDNDSETDLDCGGGFVDDMGTVNPGTDGAPTCPVGEGCLLGSDCATGVCNDNNGAGGLPDDCPAVSTCACQAASNNDGVQNGGETDTDCGGGLALGTDGAPACAPGKKCAITTDCTSFICTAGICATPTPTDGVQNGGETDVDCGGATTMGSDGAPACADNKSCGVDPDCLSAFCSALTNKCVDGQSCKGLVTPASIMDISAHAGAAQGGADAVGVPNANGAGEHAGLDSCGPGESTDLVKSHESCCKSLPVPGLAIRMDKYEVTTGRVRQFIESVKALEGGVYDIQAWVKAQFNGSLTPITPAGNALALMIPTNQAGAIDVVDLFPTSDAAASAYLNVVVQTGGTTMDEGVPSGVQGCYTGPSAFGAGTYWWNAQEMSTVLKAPPRPFTQDYYDIKPQNCMPYWMAAAFCAWDGGRLPTQAESNVVYGGSSYPWGASLYPNPYGTNTTILSRAEALDTASIPLGTFIPGNPGVPGAAGYTINFWNGNLGASTGLGDFYFYPSYPLSNPNAGPLGDSEVPDSLTGGLDLTPYIAAPGRFILDTTSEHTADGEGWADYGANMMEYLLASSLTGNLGGGYGGSGEFCDTTGGAHAPCATGAGLCQRSSTCGVIRAPPMPGISWEGGSWEGHGIQRGGYNEPMQTQYGKAGMRCVRAAEPAP
jgi:hypothetical protein